MNSSTPTGPTHELLPALHSTPFDAHIGHHGAVAFATTPLSSLRDAAHSLAGAAVNDAVLAVIAGAPRRWLQHRHGALRDVREAGEYNAGRSLHLTELPPLADDWTIDLDRRHSSAVIAPAGPHRGDVAPRQRAPHARVSTGGRRRSLLDLFDGKLTLIIGPGADAWRTAVPGTEGADGQLYKISTETSPILDIKGDSVIRFAVRSARVGDGAERQRRCGIHHSSCDGPLEGFQR